MLMQNDEKNHAGNRLVASLKLSMNWCSDWKKENWYQDWKREKGGKENSCLCVQPRIGPVKKTILSM